MCVSMIFPERRRQVFVWFLGSCLAASFFVACTDKTSTVNAEPSEVFPDASPLKHRHRNHSLTESPDGRIRIYAAQKGDITDLMIMRRDQNGRWSAPSLLELPRRETNTSPRFFPNGDLYYSSDASHPQRPGRKDLNVWRVPFADDTFGSPEVLPDSINSGSHEDGFAPLGDGRAIFSSTTLGGVGGYDLYIAHREGEAWSKTPFEHNTAMADSHPVTTKDGKTLIWYAHLPTEDIYGVVDLFVSHYGEEGWSAPLNLGPKINTGGIDYGAGFSADGKTLFFSREGVLMQADFETVLSEAGFVPLN